MDSKSAIGAVAQAFIDKINDKSAVIGIIGLGYVGLPLIMAYSRLGYNVLGVDVDQKKVDALEAGESYIGHISSDDIKTMVGSGGFAATIDFSEISKADAILICVPTPLNHHREPDISYVLETTRAIAPHLRQGQLIVLESTTYPGTTREEMQPILAEISGLKPNEDFVVGYSPEREDPGNPDFDTASIPKVVGAATKDGLAMISSLYRVMVPQVVEVSSPETAEAVKLTENIFRAVNIALVNELKLIYDDMGVDVWEVIDAAKTKPFGFMPFYPGPGLGGHCIPIDPFYLTWKAREFGRNTRFIELAGEINDNMPKHVVSRLAHAMSEHQKKAVNGAYVLVVGIAYKKNVDDMRESPSLTLIELLQERGATVDYYDSYIPVVPQTREHAELAGMKSVDWDEATLKKYDAVLISTDHDNIDWQLLCDTAPLIIDTRNALSKFVRSEGHVIEKA